MLSPCPTGWKTEPDESVDLIRYAVLSGLFPLYEIFDALRYRINERPDGTSVEEYMSRQQGYTKATADTELLKSFIEDQWRYLEAMAKAFPADGT